MTEIPTNEKRVLAVDPCTRGFGFAVLEGPDRLVDWGVKRACVGRGKNERSLELVSKLLAHHQPDAVVVEDCAGKGSRRCRRVRELIDGIRKLASEREIPSLGVSRSEIKSAFAPVRTKHQVAQAIAARFPELRPSLPPSRKCWMPEDARMAIFDAVASAIASLR
jgi:RNase H-fold protein (predicted Holliday junction resolvase)